MGKDQNEIDKEFTTEELAALDAAIAALETITQSFPVLTAAEKSAHVRPPDGAGDWMLNMAVRADQNLGKMPRDYDPARVRRDLSLDSQIEPRQLRLQRVMDRLESARFLAKSDSFSALLGVRRTLKDAGVTGVDDNLSDGLRRFFSRSSGQKPTPPPAK